MQTIDLVIILIIVIQPSVIGAVLFGLTKVVMSNKAFLVVIKNARKRYKGARFFECATFPRLLGKLKYDIQALSFVIVFLVYDVDLLFFLSEALFSDVWSNSQVFLFLLFLFFFILGLLYDITQQNFNWAY